MSGQLPSRLGTYDNAAEFPAAIPTFAHYLRLQGYRTCLVGKMHFAGPDQLHGFEERLTTDIYPAEFDWTPDWEHPEQRPTWYHNMLSVIQAGPCVTSNQLDFDEEVAFQARRYILDRARDEEGRPFCLTVSFTHPHDPFAISQPYWDRYREDEIDLPVVPALPQEQLDPHSRRLRHVCAMDQYTVTTEHVRRARHAYYAMISYVDDKIGELLQLLEATGLNENTLVVFASDHGEMLGERGLWYKMNFFEWSARVPLIVHGPKWFKPRRIRQPVSLVDLLPTLVELGGAGPQPELLEPIDGRSLVPLLQGKENDHPGIVLAELLSEGAIAPCLMIRQGDYKYIYSEPDPEQLFDLAADPHELENLAGRPEYQEVQQRFRAELVRHWDPQSLKQSVLQSQRRRRLVSRALKVGRYTPWDFQPHQDASQQYVRSHLPLDDLERRKRFPPPDLPKLDGPN